MKTVMTASLLFIIFVILIAYAFDFINGFHDAANSIATIVATEVLTPGQAVVWAAVFNFSAFLFFKLSVASMVGTGLIAPSIVNAQVIFAALSSAIIWNLLTWYYGLPSSSSHALIGGLVGAAFAKGGISVLEFSGINKVLAAIVLSPLVGALLGFLLMIFFKLIFSKRQENRPLFRYLQLASSALLSITHGGNDAQKTMGVIAVLLYSSSLLGDQFYVPFWVVISCYLVIALGTLAGGWRIIHTMGKKITELNPMRGCSAESGAAIVIGAATHFGIPISTTHTVAGAITGVGLSGGMFGSRWNVIRKIVLAWVLTLPFTALIAGIIVKIFF